MHFISTVVQSNGTCYAASVHFNVAILLFLTRVYDNTNMQLHQNNTLISIPIVIFDKKSTGIYPEENKQRILYQMHCVAYEKLAYSRLEIKEYLSELSLNISDKCCILYSAPQVLSSQKAKAHCIC